MVIYGSSLHLAGIAASLKADVRLDIICLNPHTPNARQNLKEINPAAIAYDINDPPPNLDVTLLRNCPGLLLIGVDLFRDEVITIYSQLMQVCNVSDLVNIIRVKAGREQ